MMINLLDRIKFCFRKDKRLYSSLYRILGFYPHNIKIYQTALSHSSLARRDAKGAATHNERLEFLGDAILEAAVSDIVYHKFERKREGFLTSTRSKIVSRETLNRLATELGIDKLIKTSVRPTTHHNNLGGNAFEALIGAIYLDRGYKFCKWFLEHRVLGKKLDIEGVAQKEVNFKSKLLEWSQKNRIKAEFTLTNTEKPGGNSPVFYSTVVLEGLLAGEGKGYSKKESQQLAAKDALTKMRRKPKFVEDVFLEKEKRTAMGAEEFSAVPHIEEIEESLASTPADVEATEEGATKNKRRGRRRPARRAPQKEGNETPAAEVPETEAPAEKKNRSRAARRRKKAAAVPAIDANEGGSREDIIRSAEEAAFSE